MTEFSIQRGATKICSWHLEQGTVHTHDDAAIDGSTVAIGENDKLDFVLRPEDPELEYRIRIGDVPIEDLLGDPEKAEGMSVASSRYWPKFHYIESGRGKTTIRVESRTPHTRDAQWARVIDAPVVVVPSKLGEESYLYMAAELQSLSRSLIVDLYGKSLKTFDLRFSEESGAFHSREEELDAITNALARMHPLLVQIARRPSVHIRSQVGTRRYWGSERLDAAASTRLCRQGHYRSRRPISVTSNQRVESGTDLCSRCATAHRFHQRRAAVQRYQLSTRPNPIRSTGQAAYRSAPRSSNSLVRGGNAGTRLVAAQLSQICASVVDWPESRSFSA